MHHGRVYMPWSIRGSCGAFRACNPVPDECQAADRRQKVSSHITTEGVYHPSMRFLQAALTCASNRENSLQAVLRDQRSLMRPPLRQTTIILWALTVGAIVLSACTSDKDPILPGHAIRSMQVEEDTRFSFTKSVLPGVVTVDTVEVLHTEGPLTITSISPLQMSEGLELLDVRANFQYRKATGGTPGEPGNFCLPKWPIPNGFKYTVPVAGLQLEDDDWIAVTIFLRANKPGDLSARGLRITYEKDGHAYEQTTNSTVLEVMARNDPKELVDGKCEPDSTSNAP